jgi:Glycosyltransferase family 87
MQADPLTCPQERGRGCPLSFRTRWLARLLAACVVLLSLQLAWRIYTHTGLFITLGADYALYLSQARILYEESPVEIYDRVAIDRHYKTLLNAYGHDPSYQPGTPDLWGTHVPYPPAFAWAMQTFARLPVPVGLAVWIALNLFIIVLLGIRLAQYCPQWDRLTILLFLFGSYPVIVTLVVGQFQIVVAWALTECFLALRAGKDWKAGLWLGVLLLKPHYGILLGPLLIWKQRWRAVFGVITTGVVLLGVSIAAVGLPALMAYPQSFSVMAQFRGDDPSVMINWRSLLLEIRPEVTDGSGVVLSIVLGGLTACCTALIWRGAWRSDSSTFPLRFALITLSTLLVNYHSHPYGAALLIAPLALAVTTGHTAKLSQVLALGASVIPTLVLTVGYGVSVTDGDFYVHLHWASRLLKGLLFLLFLSLLRDWLVSTEIWANVIRVALGAYQYKTLARLPGKLPSMTASHHVRTRSSSRR